MAGLEQAQQFEHAARGVTHVTHISSYSGRILSA
jgi:hypothetical protein